MNDNIDFKALWNQQNATPPSLHLLVNDAQNFKKKKQYQIIGLNILLVLTSLFIVGIWFYFEPKLISTKIGIILAVLSMVLFSSVQNTLLPLLKKEDTSLDNRAYLKLLLEVKTKQSTLQTKVISAYFLLLSLGIGLYMIEYALMMPLYWGITCYTLTFLWIAFNWFYLRPRIIKKQNLELDLLIEQFEQLNAQLEE